MHYNVQVSLFSYIIRNDVCRNDTLIDARIHYLVQAWEGKAYDYCMENLKSMGFPVDRLAFDPELVICLFL